MERQIFEGIGTLERQAILDQYFKRKTYHANDAIVKKGKKGKEMFILLEGTAKVKVSGKVFIDLNPGDVFGEFCLIGGGNRSASVVAETNTILAEKKIGVSP